MKKKKSTLAAILGICIAALALLPSACSKSMHNSQQKAKGAKGAIETHQLLGGWQIDNFEIRWGLTAKGEEANQAYGFDTRTHNYVKDKLDYVSVLFVNDSLAFRVRHRPSDKTPYCKYSHYKIDQSTGCIDLSFDDMFGFCCKRIYARRGKKGRLTLHMKKPECLRMIKEAGGYDENYMRAIDQNTKSIELWMYLSRDSLPVYDELRRYAAQGSYDKDPKNYYD